MLKAVTYKYADAGGSVDLEDGGGSVEVVSGAGKTPIALRRAAARKLRGIANRLDKEADNMVRRT